MNGIIPFLLVALFVKKKKLIQINLILSFPLVLHSVEEGKKILPNGSVYWLQIFDCGKLGTSKTIKNGNFMKI